MKRQDIQGVVYMARNKTYNRKNLLTIVLIILFTMIVLTVRLGYLMIVKSEDYAQRAKALHEEKGQSRQKEVAYMTLMGLR